MRRSVRTFLLVAFVLAIGLSTASAAFTERAYIAALNAESITVDVIGYEVDAESGEPTLLVSMQIENPTRNRIVVGSVEFEAYAGGVLVADRPPEIETLTIPPGERAETTATIPIDEGQTERTRRAIAEGTLRVDGYVWARIESKRIAIRLDHTGGTDG